MLLRSLIVLCVLLAAALLYQQRRPYPPPVSTFDPALVTSAMAYRFPDGYNPDPDFEIEIESSEGFEVEEVLPDSVTISSSKASAILKELLDGMHYKTQSYTYYTTGKVPVSFDMALCHIPRFLLEFKTEDGETSNGFYICFECGNASFFNGTLHPKSGMYTMSKEGVMAFKKLQISLFPE